MDIFAINRPIAIRPNTLAIIISGCVAIYIPMLATLILFLFLFIYDLGIIGTVGTVRPVDEDNNACGDRMLPRSNSNIERTKPNKSNMRPIITKILEYEKSYLHMGSELMSISILFYYLSSRCGGLINEVLMQEGLINKGLINDEPRSESWP
jgi:hypothetical protein